jgi:DNA-binding transcriptional MerR regulator
MMAELTIGCLARETGCKVPTIRYYEKIGLLPEPGRSSGNTRLYDTGHLARLGFIQHCRELGFPQAAIRELLELSDHPDYSCEAVTDIARAHLDDVNCRIARLTALKTELQSMIKNCSGGRIEQCRIVETLADYARSDT